MASKFELNNSTPAAPAGRINIVWQSDANGNVSGNIPEPSAGGGAVASVFGRTGAVVAVSGDYTAAQVTNAVSVTASYADPAWITSLDWGKINNKPAIPNQTPWTQHIDGAGFELRSAGNVGVGNSVSVLDAAYPAGYRHLIVGAPDNGILTLAGNGTTIGPALNFSNYALAGSDKRIASIFCPTEGVADSGKLIFITSNLGSFAERMRITPGGNVGIGTASPADKLTLIPIAYAPTQDNGIRLQTAGGEITARISLKMDGAGVPRFTLDSPNGVGAWSESLVMTNIGNIGMPRLAASNPGAGTKQLWYDPADGNRVKFAA